jgi:hypothetical protein
VHHPPTDPVSWPEKPTHHTGVIAMTVSLFNLNGDRLYSVELKPARA